MIYKYTVEITLLLNTLFRLLHMETLLLAACRWRIPRPFLFRPKLCCSWWDHLQFCGFNPGNSMICWFSFLFTEKYLDKPVKFRNVPFFIDNRWKFRLTLQTEGLSKNLELPLARLRSNNTVNLLAFGINDEEIPFFYRAQHYHLIYVILNSSVVEFFAKMLSYLDWNVRKWNSQGQ